MARVKIRLHGGDVYGAARELGCEPAEIVDFSASINPLGPSSRVWNAITDARRLLNHYPDPDCWELRQALARFWRIDPEHIVVGNGSTELIDAIPRAFGISRLLVVQPTFSEYAAAVMRTGGKVLALYADPKDNYAIPVDRLCHVMSRGRTGASSIDAVILCHPNSPTGQACSADDVARLAKAARRGGVWLIIDEAFVDYCPERSVLSQVTSWPRVIVLRSMTKFYALPGLRVGYAVAARTTAGRLQRQLPPWSVNVMGQAAALAALSDIRHAKESMRFMAKERSRLAAALATLPGCAILPTCANYFFVELPHRWQARPVVEQLRREGLLIRDCSSVPGAPSGAIRLAVRTPQENDRLCQALSQVLHGKLL